MKLFVWPDALTDYSSGVMFAYAETVEQARELVAPGYAADEEKAASGCQRYLGLVHCELRADPEVYDGKPFGCAVWGGG